MAAPTSPHSPPDSLALTAWKYDAYEDTPAAACPFSLVWPNILNEIGWLIKWGTVGLLGTTKPG